MYNMFNTYAFLFFRRPKIPNNKYCNSACRSSNRGCECLLLCLCVFVMSLFVMSLFVMSLFVMSLFVMSLFVMPFLCFCLDPGPWGPWSKAPGAHGGQLGAGESYLQSGKATYCQACTQQPHTCTQPSHRHAPKSRIHAPKSIHRFAPIFLV